MARYWNRERPSWATEILLILPLFLLYQVGTLTTDMRNGVDLISTLFMRLQEQSQELYLVFAAALIGATVWLYLHARKKEAFQASRIIPVGIESLIYALLMGTVIIFIMVRIFGMQSPAMAAEKSRDPLLILFISAGAGVHEELVFRLGIFGGLLYGLTIWAKRTPALWILIIALAVSSVLFSLAHHIPPHGEPFAIFPFVFRVLAGAIFGLIYHFRGLAIAVWTHFLYDVYVMFLHGV